MEFELITAINPQYINNKVVIHIAVDTFFKFIYFSSAFRFTYKYTKNGIMSTRIQLMVNIGGLYIIIYINITQMMLTFLFLIPQNDPLVLSALPSN